MSVVPKRPWWIIKMGGKRTRVVDDNGQWVCDCRSDGAAELLVNCVNAAHEIEKRAWTVASDFHTGGA